MVELRVSNDLLVEVQQAAAAYQPELKVTTGKDVIIMDGLLVVSGPAGPFDSFDVKIGVLAGFPLSEPIVVESGGRIPKVADRHVFPEQGNCCIGVWEEWLLTAPDHSFENFVTGILHDYFLSQTYFEAKGEWPFGERSHGLSGVWESFAELLRLENDPTIIVEHLRLLSLNELKGHNPCPCGSGKKLRQCHRPKVEELRARIPSAIARRMLKRVVPNRPRRAMPHSANRSG